MGWAGPPPHGLGRIRGAAVGVLFADHASSGRPCPRMTRANGAGHGPPTISVINDCAQAASVTAFPIGRMAIAETHSMRHGSRWRASGALALGP